jgi:hypothetical protein
MDKLRRVTGSPDIGGGFERLLALPAAGLAALYVDQTAIEYGSRSIGYGLRWTFTVAQEHWYYVVGAVVLLVIVWRYLSK